MASPKILAVEVWEDCVQVTLEADDGERRTGKLSAGALWALVQTRPATWDGRDRPPRPT